MFKRKNLLVAVAVSMLLAACGGGGDDPVSAAAGGTGTGTGTGTGGGDGATTGTFAGTYTLAGDQVLFAPSSDLAVTLAQVAAGTIGPFATGVNSPVAQAGFRLGAPTLPDGTAAGVKQNARFAVSFVEQPGSVAAGEDAEALQVLVPVTFTTTATGGATVAPTDAGQAYIYYKPKTGAARNVAVSAADLIKSVAVTGDSTSSFLAIDLDAALAKAGATFASAKDISGTFNMATALSNVTIRNEAGTALPAASVTVTGSNQAAVSGSGVTGTIAIN